MENIAIRNTITLKSSDGEEFNVPVAVAMQCKTISHLIEDGWDRMPIPLFNVTAKILKKVIDYCMQHVDAAYALEIEIAEEGTSIAPALLRMSDKELSNWDKQFMDVDQKTHFDLINAANYLHIDGLLHLTYQKLAKMIEGKNPEEIRQMLNIRNDFTAEEEQEVYRENEWTFY